MLPKKNVYTDSMRVFLKCILAFVCMCVFVPNLASSMSIKKQKTKQKPDGMKGHLTLLSG